MNIQQMFWISNEYQTQIFFCSIFVWHSFPSFTRDARPVLNIKWISNSCFEYRMNIKQLFWISNEYQTLIFFCSIFVWHSFPSFTLDARPVLNIKWISNRCFEYRMNIKRKFFSVRYSFDIHFRALHVMLGLFWISNEYQTAVLNIEWISNSCFEYRMNIKR